MMTQKRADALRDLCPDLFQDTKRLVPCYGPKRGLLFYSVPGTQTQVSTYIRERLLEEGLITAEGSPTMKGVDYLQTWMARCAGLD